MKNPKFYLYKTKAGHFRFTLSAANGQFIAASQDYETKEGALNGIASVKRCAPDAQIEDAINKKAWAERNVR